MQYDAIVIGTGQAGVPLAGELAEKGKKTAVIEKGPYGGACVNYGCTPTKTYVASARAAWAARRSHEMGVFHDGNVRVDLKKVKERKDEIVQSSRESIGSWFDELENIDTYRGHARFTGPKSVEVNGRTLEAPQIFINTGARPRIPERFEGLDYLTNQSILELEELPEHLLIVGGSYVGLEFGQMFHRFGSKVTIIEKSKRLIGREDPEISDAIAEILREAGIELHLEAECISGKTENGKIILDLNREEGERQVSGTHLLLATGRIPNTDDLGLDKAGIETDERGNIKVNDKLETSVPGVWALGDCNGEGAFTHTSVNDYHILSDNLFNNGDRRISDRFMAYGLFIDPPLGRVGMTEQQARKTGKEVLVASMPMSRVGRANEMGETEGLMKIVIDEETDHILGAAILGIRGDEVVHAIIDVMYAGAPYTVIRDAMHIHPTVSELAPTMLKNV